MVGLTKMKTKKTETPAPVFPENENEIRKIIQIHLERKDRQNDLFYQIFAVAFSVVFNLLILFA